MPYPVIAGRTTFFDYAGLYGFGGVKMTYGALKHLKLTLIFFWFFSEDEVNELPPSSGQMCSVAP